MGLDMYLKAQRHIGGWEHVRNDNKRSDEAKMFDSLVELTGIKPCNDCPSFELCATVGYWRKANSIHNWFVENIQNGKDECQLSYVTREQLTTLRDLCNQVLGTVETVDGTLDAGSTYYPDGKVEHHTVPGKVVAQANIAAAVLPSRPGFFFGSTSYDEYYLSDLRDTVKILDAVLTNKTLEECDFYYQASW